MEFFAPQIVLKLICHNTRAGYIAVQSAGVWVQDVSLGRAPGHSGGVLPLARVRGVRAAGEPDGR